MISPVFHKWRSARYLGIISTEMFLLPLICFLHSAGAAPPLTTEQLDMGVLSWTGQVRKTSVRTQSPQLASQSPAGSTQGSSSPHRTPLSLERLGPL
ncbi:unnamed protein product [Arctogadus glacialis]